MAFFEFPHTRSYDSDLGWLIRKYDDLSKAYDTLMDCCNDVQTRLKALEDLYNMIMSGDFPESIKLAFSRWMYDHALDIIGELATSVFFEISDEGYWIAYIPESWHDIIFNTTGLDITLDLQPDYGHLVLSY